MSDSEKAAGTCQKLTTLAIVDEVRHQKSNLECHIDNLETQLPNVIQNNYEENKTIAHKMNIPRIFTPVKISTVNNGENVNDDLAKIHQCVEDQKVAPPLPLSATLITDYANRSASAGSAKSTGALSTGSMSGDICRICHCESAPDAPLIAPCYCSGTLKYVHQKCLQQWIKSSQTRSCEVCRFSFIMQTKVKPFRKWEKLDIGTVERRKILCNVTFHIVVLICIIWSLYVLIERTAVEIRDSSLEWPFWTKLVVMAIGFTGCTVLVYVQWRTYVRLFKRWRAYNRVIFVQNGPSVHKGEVGGAAMVMADAGQRSGATKQPTQTTASRAQTTTTMVVEIK